MTKPFRPPRRVSGKGFSSEFLDAETEARLARAWRERGDERARDRLVLAHRAMAYSAAARLTRQGGRPDEDLIQQANIGLLKAADRFDPDMGFRFSTYASWWVRAEIQEYSYGDWSLIKLPGASSLRRLFFGLRRTEAELIAAGETAPEDMDSAIAAKFGVDVDKVTLVRDRLAARDMSLNQTVGQEDGGAEWQDMLPDTDPMSDAEVRVGAERAQARLAQILADHMARLPERDRKILQGTVVEDDSRTLADLGEEFNISRERVRQLRERALGSLRKALAQDETADRFLKEEGLIA